ncbi:hypothetical protein KC19_9G100500 [Ceratodon purpureus]|uniref:Pectate lyase n=2 Tax=Ceratodon purpureus TaxID=3225 RepID=A0A8T0GU31_CERPU|nr:hypothetical protein KC19_9G100500 [Ceratodon purpureus]
MAPMPLNQFLLFCWVAGFTILLECSPSESRPLEHLRFQAYTRHMDTSEPPKAAPGPVTNRSWNEKYVIQEGPNGIIQERNSTETEFDSLAADWGTCGTGNPMDDCWRCDENWESHRQSLATCAMGFGRDAIGGKNGQIYMVTSAEDDDAANPQPGTLRYAATREEPLWITFAKSMTIYLQEELILTSFKTIDGRGVDVHITGGAGLTLQYISNVIIHGIHIHDIKVTGPARVMSNTTHVGDRGVTDGDAINIYTATQIWIDHCSFANAADGLIDAIHGSSMITISNNLFSNHDKVMLFGAHNIDTVDREMKATVAFNKFGAGLTQRMPRCRFGTFQIVNNDYSAGWGIYAIGGSESPTILSEGNHFVASSEKEVTKRIDDGGDLYGGYQSWNWISAGDLFANGAYFTSSGDSSLSSPVYTEAFSLTARPANYTQALAASSGPLSCTPGQMC